MRIQTIAFAATLALSSTALAQDPAFKFSDDETEAELDKKKGVEWAANAQAGLVLTTGNSRITTLSAGAAATRKANRNKFELTAGGTFSRSSILLANDDNGDGSLSQNEIDRLTQTTARSWNTKGRYDRFLSDMDSLYAALLASGDKPAGKQFVGGGQLGYSRTLVADDVHNLVAEVGYDLSYEDPVVGDGVAIHSIRSFAGYTGKLSDDTGVDLSVEGLFNVNDLDTSVGNVDRFEDTRVLSKLGLSTKMFEDISFRFGFEARYDNAPSGLPPFGIPYTDGFVPLADELDTKAEASLIVNFL